MGHHARSHPRLIMHLYLFFERADSETPGDVKQVRRRDQLYPSEDSWKRHIEKNYTGFEIVYSTVKDDKDPYHPGRIQATVPPFGIVGEFSLRGNGGWHIETTHLYWNKPESLLKNEHHQKVQAASIAHASRLGHLLSNL